MNKSGSVYTNLSPNKAPPTFGLVEQWKLIKKVLLDTSRRPSGPVPEVTPDLNEFLKPSSHLKFIWFGHSTLLLNVDGKIILIDPVFSETASPFSFLVKRFQKPVLKLTELPHIDVVLISHNHYDHLDKKTISFFKNKATGFIVPIGVGDDLRDWGIPAARIKELNWGESASHSNISFTATPSQHFSGRGLFDRNKSLWVSWVIKGNDQSLYYSGDSGYGEHFRQIGDKYGPFDVTFIENGQYNERWPDVHMQPEESLQAHLDLNGKYMVPVHWGMFDLALHHWTEPVERTTKIARAWDIPVITPRLGEMVDLAIKVENKPWWTAHIEQSFQEIGTMLVPEIIK